MSDQYLTTMAPAARLLAPDMRMGQHGRGSRAAESVSMSISMSISVARPSRDDGDPQRKRS
jgi:hypothetical protein